MATTTTTTSRAGTAPVAEARQVQREPSYYVILAIRYIALILMTIFFLGPFIMALLGSFKTTGEVLAWPPTLLPNTWRPQNYTDVFNALTDANGNSLFPRWILNSFILSASITVAQVFFCSLAGFSYAR